MLHIMSSTPPSQQPGAPLDRGLSDPGQLLFASGDVDEVRSMVGRVMKPHSLRIIGGGERLDARMHFMPLGDVSVSRLRYGSAVEIGPGPLEDFFLVQMPLIGSAAIDSGAQHIDSYPELASVLSPDDDTCMRWAAGNDQLMVRISRSLLERTLVGQLNHPLERPLHFELGFRWRDNPLWQCLLNYLMNCSAQCPGLKDHKLVIDQIEQLVASTLLATQRHNYSDTPPARRGTILPRHIRRAKDYVKAHAHEPISAEQLAQVAGVSVRSLYAGFKEYLGVSPMQYLRDLRMECARTELTSGEASNVAGVALRWGFAHMGRFSNDYKQRYGETPSQTLRQR
ncbi:TPA: AraC family transcriptional regulator [Burkholderia vietnamiensis]|nr:AraC family transcriptional regulator [Burkholderia vietnamiensis]